MNKEIINKIRKSFHPSVRQKMIFKQMDNLPAPVASCLTKQGFIIVLVNPKILEQTDPNLWGAFATHEFFHYLFGHLSEYKTMDDKYKEDHNKLNIAMDLEVNSEIHKLQVEPWIHPDLFKLPHHLEWREYWDLIPQDKSGGKGKCSCSMENKEEVKKALEEAAKSLGYDLSEPKPEEVKPKPVPRKVLSSIKSQIERSMAQILDAKVSRQRLANASHKWKEGGFGKKRAYQPRLAFAIDCSGSTSGEQVTQYYSLVRALVKEYTADVIEFDTAIRHVGKRPSGTSWGGGTVFECVKQHTDKVPYDLLVWFTDAEGQLVKTKAPSIYVLTEKSNTDQCKELSRKVINI